MYLLLFKNFFRSRSAYLGLAFLLLSGVISIYIGKQFIDKQENNIENTAKYQQDHIQRYVKYFDKEAGLLLYYLKFGLVNNTDNLNALSVGQRDINPSVQSLTIRNIEGQKYDTDLNNPVSLLFGNLDMGFVIIFLFPLVIISFCYNLLSEEKEESTWVLVAVQSPQPIKILFQKLLVRFVSVIGVFMILMILAFIILDLSFNTAFFGFVTVSLFYLSFWFALSLWIVSLKKNSSINAASLLSFWIILIIVLPALLNNFIINRYPLPEALDTVIEQREGYHAKWDTDKKATMEKFYKHYPQFSSFSYPKESFNWLWYYAMQQMGDDESKAQSDQLVHKLWEREKMSRSLSFFIPGLHTQFQFSDLTHSGLSNQLKFMQATGKFHEKMRLYFYPKIFANEPISNLNWDAFQPEHYHEDFQPNWWAMLGPLFVFSLLLGILTMQNFRKPVL